MPKKVAVSCLKGSVFDKRKPKEASTKRVEFDSSIDLKKCHEKKSHATKQVLSRRIDRKAKGDIVKKPKINSAGTLELASIDFREKNDSLITQQLMDQMKTVGFCQIVNVPGHSEAKLKKAM